MASRGPKPTTLLASCKQGATKNELKMRRSCGTDWRQKRQPLLQLQTRKPLLQSLRSSLKRMMLKHVTVKTRKRSAAQQSWRKSSAERQRPNSPRDRQMLRLNVCGWLRRRPSALRRRRRSHRDEHCRRQRKPGVELLWRSRRGEMPKRPKPSGWRKRSGRGEMPKRPRPSVWSRRSKRGEMLKRPKPSVCSTRLRQNALLLKQRLWQSRTPHRTLHARSRLRSGHIQRRFCPQLTGEVQARR
mmetsp:Transcript_1163/g.2177  ORF Transcript_1163/g.2177 Transcript_1163/m.2177 type:complete len:243 (-) Transcript_1163:28-756(-)